MNYIKKESLKVATAYFGIGFIWILFFGTILIKMPYNIEKINLYGLHMALFFLILTSFLIYVLVKKGLLSSKKYQKELEIEIERKNYLANISDDSFIVIDDSGKVINCNDVSIEVFGISKKELIAKSIIDLAPEYQLNGVKTEQLINSKLKLVRDGKNQDFECCFNNFSRNNVFHAKVELKNRQPKSENIFAKIKDLTILKKYKTELHNKNLALKKRNEELSTTIDLLEEHKEKFKILFQNAPIAYQSLDIKGNFLSVNNTWLDILGYNRNQVVGKHFSHFMTKGSAKRGKTLFERFKKNGKVSNVVFEMVRKDKTIISAQFQGEIGYNSDGSFKQAYFIFIDITEQLNKDKALKESYQRYKTVADFTYGWEYWILPDGNFEYISPSCERITGYTREEFIKKPDLINDIVMLEDKEIWRDHKKTIRIDLIRDSEIIFRIKHKEGGIRWIGHYCEPVYNEEGKYIGRRGSHRDITGRILAEKIMFQERDLANNILESTQAGIWDWNVTDNKLKVNERWAEIIGYTLNELRPIDAENVFKRMHPDDEEKVRLLLEKVFKQEINYFDIDFRLKHKNESWIWVHSRGKVIEWSKRGNPIKMIGTNLDINERKQLEKDAMNRIIMAEEKERERIAKELHDGVSPVLSAVKLYCQSLSDTSEEKIRKELVGKISGTINESIISISEISNNISPHILKNFGLILAVETFIGRISELGLINISIDNKLEKRVKENTEVNLYRITTELINNTMKYAKANNILIKYYEYREHIFMVYSDDGKGFDINKIKKSKGMGVLNIRNRIKLLDGQFVFTSEPNQGINIEISIPIN